MVSVPLAATATNLSAVDSLDRLRAGIDELSSEISSGLSDHQFLSALKRLHALQTTMQAACGVVQSQGSLTEDLLVRPRR